MDFTKKEQDVLNETLTCLEQQFDDDLDAVAEVFDADEEWIDVEVQLNDDSSEQFKIERCLLLEEDVTPVQIAESVN